MRFPRTFYALSDPNRQKIIELLKKNELAVADILKHIPITGASLSHHLTVLKTAGLISARREGQRIICSLNLSVFEEIIQELSKLFKK